MRSADLLAQVGKAHGAAKANCLGNPWNAVQVGREARPEGLNVDSALGVTAACFRMTKAALRCLDCEIDVKPETSPIASVLPTTL